MAMINRTDDPVIAVGEIDARIRESIRLAWYTQSKNFSVNNAEMVEKQIKALVERALKDFKEDVDRYERRMTPPPGN